MRARVCVQPAYPFHFTDDGPLARGRRVPSAYRPLLPSSRSPLTFDHMTSPLPPSPPSHPHPDWYGHMMKAAGHLIDWKNNYWLVLFFSQQHLDLGATGKHQCQTPRAPLRVRVHVCKQGGEPASLRRLPNTLLMFPPFSI